MTTIDIIIQDDIIAKLNTLLVVNGFNKDVSVLNGYMVHYANDLLDREEGIGFPCVAVQPDSDQIIMNQDQTKAKINRVVKLIGAVDSTDRSTVNAELNQLVYDVRKVLSINKFDNVSLATDIELGNTKFTLPEDQEQYAFFEMNLSLNYVELWK